MSLKSFCIDLRKEIIALISGINNAGYSLYWDNTTPNYATRRKLHNVFLKYTELASKYGIIYITRHTCSNKEHKKVDDYYLVTNPYGLDISYQDEKFVWNNSQLRQCYVRSECPCSPNKEANEHYVIEEFVFSKDADMATAMRLTSILCDIFAAIEQSGDKQPRSGIREYLLRAVLELNDLILPSPMEEYIQSLSESPSPNA